MPALRQNDDLLTWENDLRKAEGEEDAKRLDQIARAGYVSTKSTLYAVSAAMSHVSKELAAGDPGFWRPKQVIASKTSGVKANAALGEDPVTTKSIRVENIGNSAKSIAVLRASTRFKLWKNAFTLLRVCCLPLVEIAITNPTRRRTCWVQNLQV